MTPYEFTIPDSGVAALFVDGEMALAPASPIASAAAGTFYLAKRFLLEPGVYTVKLYADDLVSLWTGSDRFSSSRVAVTALGAAPLVAQFYARGGDTRVDLVLAHLASATECYVALSLWRNDKLVYASTATGWVLDPDPIPDEDLASPGDARRVLPVFTLTPNWGDGVIERLEWSTTIESSETDDEQRRSMRRHPRRSFEAQFLRAGKGRQYLDNFIVGVGANRFLVPLWHEQYRMPAELSGDSLAFPTGTLQHREFAAGDLVLVIQDRDPHTYDVLEVESLAGDTLTFTAAPATTWPAGTWVRPLREVWMPDSPSMESLTSTVAHVGLRFVMVDTDTSIEPAWWFNEPVWRHKPNWAAAISGDFGRKLFTFDTPAAQVVFVDPAQQSRITQRMGILLQGREEVRAFRSFVAMTRGKAVRFYMPAWTDDLAAADDLGGDIVSVERSGLSEFVRSAQQARSVIAVEFRDGSPALYRKVIGVEPDGDRDLLLLERALPGVPRSQVKRMQWLVPSRFDQDAFELLHHVDASKAVSVNLVTRSSDGVDMDVPRGDGPVLLLHFDGNMVDATGLNSFVGGGQGFSPGATGFGQAASTGGAGVGAHASSAVSMRLRDRKFTLEGRAFPGSGGVVLSKNYWPNETSALAGGFHLDYQFIVRSNILQLSWSGLADDNNPRAAIATSGWFAWAFCDDGVRLRFYVDGVKVADAPSVSTMSPPMPVTGGEISVFSALQGFLGETPNWMNSPYGGLLDEMRMHIGVALYTGDSYPLLTTPFVL